MSKKRMAKEKYIRIWEIVILIAWVILHLFNLISKEIFYSAFFAFIIGVKIEELSRKPDRIHKEK